jgi:predicted permease
MVISEVALACVLLAGAGLLLRSFLAVLDIDLGFQPSRAAVMKIDFDDGGGKHERRGPVLQEILGKVQTIPGIEAAGIADMLPLGRNRSWGFALKGKTYPPGLPGEIALVRIITPGYLSAMGMHLQTGRDFTWRDSMFAPQVMIVNQAAARRFWPNTDSLGHIVHTNGDKSETQVIGVLSNVRENTLEALPEPEVYLPMTQANPEGAELVVRTNRPLPSLATQLLNNLRSLNPAQPASELQPLQQIVDRSVSPRRFFAVLVAGFALLGLVLASLGIYGVISYSVSRQTQEIGIRMALGATSQQVQRNVITRALRLTIIGVSIGTLASLIVARWISSLLFATKASDPLTFTAIVLLLIVVALTAGYIPARRASRIDPMIALRTS